VAAVEAPELALGMAGSISWLFRSAALGLSAPQAAARNATAEISVQRRGEICMKINLSWGLLRLVQQV
jgi:hypothetical protein